MVEPLRHRQTKGAATDMFYLTSPRHISTLPFPDLSARNRDVRFAPLNRRRQFEGLRPKSAESRCDAVALGSSISVAAPFVRRCLTGSTMAPFSHPAHRTGQADFPHPALGQNFTPTEP